MSSPDKSNAVIVRECPECGGGSPWSAVSHHYTDCSRIGLPLVERTYVAVDALLSDEALDAARKALNDLPPDVLTAETARSASNAVRAALEAATSRNEVES